MQQRVEGHRRFDVRGREIQKLRDVFDGFVFDIPVLLLRGEQQRDQGGSLSRIDRSQVSEPVFSCFREHLLNSKSLLAFPFERAFFPDVDVARQDRRHEQQHLEKTE